MIFASNVQIKISNHPDTSYLQIQPWNPIFLPLVLYAFLYLLFIFIYLFISHHLFLKRHELKIISWIQSNLYYILKNCTWIWSSRRNIKQKFEGFQSQDSLFSNSAIKHKKSLLFMPSLNLFTRRLLLE